MSFRKRMAIRFGQLMESKEECKGCYARDVKLVSFQGSDSSIQRSGNYCASCLASIQGKEAIHQNVFANHSLESVRLYLHRAVDGMSFKDMETFGDKVNLYREMKYSLSELYMRECLHRCIDQMNLPLLKAASAYVQKQLTANESKEKAVFEKSA